MIETDFIAGKEAARSRTLTAHTDLKAERE